MYLDLDSGLRISHGHRIFCLVDQCFNHWAMFVGMFSVKNLELCFSPPEVPLWEKLGERKGEKGEIRKEKKGEGEKKKRWKENMGGRKKRRNEKRGGGGGGRMKGRIIGVKEEKSKRGGGRKKKGRKRVKKGGKI